MLIGCFGDAHLTKNMRNLQYMWDTTAIKSFYNMYDKFDELNVEGVVGLGDLLDSPRIEAKHMQLVLPLLKHINERTYPTYLLLGNHEIDSEDSNILDFLSMYDNIIPITTLTEIENMLFIPYNVDPTEIEYKRNHIVFTHHDLYGSQLAGGKTKAFFGFDPAVFDKALLVLNGHVHLKSLVRINVVNAGAFLVSSQGELKVGEYPQYYTVDTKKGNLSRYNNEYSMIYLTIPQGQLHDLDKFNYDKSKLVLKVEYEGELPKDLDLGNLHTSYRKVISGIATNDDNLPTPKNFDIRNYLTEYLKKDSTIKDSDKEDYITTGLELLS